jgi:hypothetical protein
MTCAFHDDDLDGFEEEVARTLTDLPDSSDRLRAQLFAPTNRVQARRRTVRRLRTIAAWALLYLAGFQTAQWSSKTDTAPADGTSAHLADLAADQSPQRDADVSATSLPSNPADLEERARSGSPQRRAERLREAGDLYLTRDTDVSSAVRCYRKYLECLPSAEQAAPDSGDSWLLIALKRDVQQRSS